MGTYERADLYKAAPEKPEDMYDYIVGRIKDFKDEELKRLSDYLVNNEQDILARAKAISNPMRWMS